MRDIRIHQRTDSIVLGYAGENAVNQLIIDASEFDRDFPGGQMALFMERPDKMRYSAEVKKQGSDWTHVITGGDVEIPGRGFLQHLNTTGLRGSGWRFGLARN